MRYVWSKSQRIADKYDRSNISLLKAVFFQWQLNCHCSYEAECRFQICWNAVFAKHSGKYLESITSPASISIFWKEKSCFGRKVSVGVYWWKNMGVRSITDVSVVQLKSATKKKYIKFGRLRHGNFSKNVTLYFETLFEIPLLFFLHKNVQCSEY